MTKRKKKPPEKSDIWKHLELQVAVIQHCNALRSVADFLERGQTELAVARLDQAVAALGAVIRGQAIGIVMKCPQCQTDQSVVQWVDDKTCDHCGGTLG